MSARAESTTAKKRVLFVCTHNEVRSLTAEHVYRGRPDLEIRSAGLASHAKNRLTSEAVDWADMVVVFEPQHAQAIEREFPMRRTLKDLVCLGLPDKFEYKSPRLVVKLISKLKPYLGEPSKPEPKPRTSEVSLFRRLVQGTLF